MSHTVGLLHYLAEHWPFIAAVMATLGGTVMWVKRKVINDVYATKDEMNNRFKAREEKVNHQFSDMTTLINSNHSEIKDLFIEHISKDK
jgi:hypothetical protein